LNAFLLKVLEYAPGGELFDRIVKKTYYDEKEARALCSVLVNAVHHMHSHDVMHRDLKPENLLMAGKSDDEVKVADFGFARSTKEGLRKTQCGTPGL
jgi:serine/threonine protein kinase